MHTYFVMGILQGRNDPSKQKEHIGHYMNVEVVKNRKCVSYVEEKMYWGA